MVFKDVDCTNVPIISTSSSTDHIYDCGVPRRPIPSHCMPGCNSKPHCHRCCVLSDYTYSILKRVCRKIIKDYNRQQCREKYTVFGGGNSVEPQTHSLSPSVSCSQRESVRGMGNNKCFSSSVLERCNETTLRKLREGIRQGDECENLRDDRFLRDANKNKIAGRRSGEIGDNELSGRRRSKTKSKDALQTDGASKKKDKRKDNLDNDDDRGTGKKKKQKDTDDGVSGKGKGKRKGEADATDDGVSGKEKGKRKGDADGTEDGVSGKGKGKRKGDADATDDGAGKGKGKRKGDADATDDGVSGKGKSKRKGDETSKDKDKQKDESNTGTKKGKQKLDSDGTSKETSKDAGKDKGGKQKDESPSGKGKDKQKTDADLSNKEKGKQKSDQDTGKGDKTKQKDESSSNKEKGKQKTEQDTGKDKTKQKEEPSSGKDKNKQKSEGETSGKEKGKQQTESDRRKTGDKRDSKSKGTDKENQTTGSKGKKSSKDQQDGSIISDLRMKVRKGDDVTTRKSQIHSKGKKTLKTGKRARLSVYRRGMSSQQSRPSRADEARTCDYLRANMEQRELCDMARVCATDNNGYCLPDPCMPCNPCLPCTPCGPFIPNDSCRYFC